MARNIGQPLPVSSGVDRRKDVLQNARVGPGGGGLRIGYGANPVQNTGHFNTAINEMHNGGPTERERQMKLMQAAQYRADLQAQIQSKQARQAREKQALLREEQQVYYQQQQQQNLQQ